MVCKGKMPWLLDGSICKPISYGFSGRGWMCVLGGGGYRNLSFILLSELKFLKYVVCTKNVIVVKIDSNILYIFIELHSWTDYYPYLRSLHRSVLLYSEECSGNCGGFSRQFRASWDTWLESHSTRALLPAFIDLKENVSWADALKLFYQPLNQSSNYGFGKLIGKWGLMITILCYC